MIKKTLLTRAAFCVLLLLFSCAPGHRIFPQTNHAPVDPRIVHDTLSNGFQYILIKNGTPKNRVDMHLNVFAGSMHETDKQQGLAHFLEHMLFNGSENFPPGELIKYFQKIGMDFGADANAHTSFFNTVYDLSLPMGGPAHIHDALTVMLDYAKGALLLPEEVDRERGIILAEKQERDSVSYRMFKTGLAFELQGSKYINRFPIGIESVLKTASRSDLKTFYDRWYRPDNMALVMIGQFDVASTRKMIHDRFSKLKSRAIPGRYDFLSTKWKPHEGIKGFYHHEPEAGSTDITIETINWVPFKPQTIEELKERATLRLSNLIVQNRLSRMIRNQESHFDEADIYSGKYLRHIEASAITASCKSEKWKASLIQIENVLRQALDFGFKEREFERARADFIAMLESSGKQENTQKSEVLAKQIISKINKKELLLSENQKKELLLPHLNSLTAEKVHRIFKEAWDTSNRLVMVSGNAIINDASPARIVEGAYTSAQDIKVMPYKQITSKAFPYLKIENHADNNIVSRQENLAGLDITSVIFNNNIKLYLKKTEFKDNQFNFNISFGNGNFSIPNDKPGLELFTQSVIEQSGLGALTADELDDALSGKDIDAQFKVKDRAFSYSGTADPCYAETVFQLIYHFLNDPGVREEAVLLSKSRYRQDFDNLKRTAEGVLKIKGERFLYSDEYRFAMPSPEEYSALTSADIKNWIMPYFKQAPVEISMVGDIDINAFIEFASKYIAPMSKRFSAEPASDIPMLGRLRFPSGQTQNFEVETKIDTAMVRMVFPTDDFWDISQTRRLSMLSRLISERLRVSIREELGVAYSPYAYNDASLIYSDTGMLHLSVITKPEQLDIVHNAMKKIIEQLHDTGVTPEEVEMVLKPVINHIKVIRSTNGYWINSVLDGVTQFPVKLAWAGHMLDDYAAINSHDMNRLIKKYLNQEKCAVFFITPGK